MIIPVVIRKATGEIIDGAHRAKLAEDYPTIELDDDEHEAGRLAVVPNLARRHLRPDQKANLVVLLGRAKFTQKDIADAVGVTQGRVSQIINTNNETPLSFAGFSC